MTALLFIVSLVVWPVLALFQAAGGPATRPVPGCSETLRAADPAVGSTTSVRPNSLLVCARPS
jgi:hypothetical protein